MVGENIFRKFRNFQILSFFLSKIFFCDVSNFIEIYGGIKNYKENQSSLFEETKISFEDKNLFQQNISEWSSVFLLKNELEVIGFYFSNHPLSLYPINYFRKNMILDYDDIINDINIKNTKVSGSILDIKERSNKDGKKYAFITISNIRAQFEVAIFSDTISLYKDLIKEGIW